jgi:hypothetical protein
MGADGSKRFDEHHAAPDGAPSPPAPLPRCAGERGEFDRAPAGSARVTSPRYRSLWGRGWERGAPAARTTPSEAL